MTLLNYTDFVPTPAPLSAGAPFQSYTDPTGEVWVAQGGVYSGQWKKARDVLNGLYNRTGTWNTATSTTLMLYDTLVYDAYGLYNTSTGSLVVPVAGIWRCDQNTAATATATGQWVQARMDVTGQTGASYGMAHASAATWVEAVAWLQRKMNAGDSCTTYQAASAVLTGRVDAGSGNCKFSFAYLGTG